MQNQFGGKMVLHLCCSDIYFFSRLAHSDLIRIALCLSIFKCFLSQTLHSILLSAQALMFSSRSQMKIAISDLTDFLCNRFCMIWKTILLCAQWFFGLREPRHMANDMHTLKQAKFEERTRVIECESGEFSASIISDNT